jgi:hypothetical protein
MATPAMNKLPGNWLLAVESSMRRLINFLLSSCFW